MRASNGSYPLFNESAKVAILDLALGRIQVVFPQQPGGPYGIAGLGYSRARFYGVSLSPEESASNRPLAHGPPVLGDLSPRGPGLADLLPEHLGWERASEAATDGAPASGTFTRNPAFTAAVTFEF